MKITSTGHSHALTHFNPSDARLDLRKAEAAIKLAAELQDREVVGCWADKKLDVCADICAWWRAHVTPRHRPGRGGAELGADRRLIHKAQAEQTLGISHQQVSRMSRRLERRDEWRESIIESALRAVLAKADIDNHRAQGTGENEWYTPAVHVERVRALMGGIDLDPASSSSAQKIVRATAFYTIRDSGLEHEWPGRVWLNPPYAQPAIQNFAQKWADEAASGRMTESVMLTHNYTDTQWFHIAAAACSAICFTRGRIAFLSPDGTPAAPTQGQAFFYFGPRPDAFAAAFAAVGFVR